MNVFFHSLAWRLCGIFLIGTLLQAGTGCNEGATTDRPEGAGTPSAATQNGTKEVKAIGGLDESTQLALAEFHRGAAFMEQYDYAKAARAFERVLEMAPDWTAALQNRGLAYLNMAGESEKEKRLGDDTDLLLETAITTFKAVLDDEPDNLHAKFCLGMVNDYQGNVDEAFGYFEDVFEADGEDSFVAYCYAKALCNLDRHTDAIPILERIVERDPGFISAVYRLGTLYARFRRRAEATALMTRSTALRAKELAVGSFVVDDKYGMAGKYYAIIGPDGLPLPPPESKPLNRILFSPETRELPGISHAWDWSGGRVGLAGVAVADVDSDRDLDILLAAQEDTGKASILLNDGAGNFTSGEPIADAVVSPCFGDVDNDGDIDLWLGRAGSDQVLLNDGQGQFSAATFEGIQGPDSLTPVATLADVDSDGDLDFLAFRVSKGNVPLRGESVAASSSVFFNNGDGTFVDNAAALGLSFADTPVAAVVYDDFDNDLDLDLVVFPSKGSPVPWMNFRVGQYRVLDASASGLPIDGTFSATSGDPDKDGNRDLLVFSQGGVRLFANNGGFQFEENDSFASAHGRLGGTGGQFVDMDNDGDLDIVIPDATRRDGSRGPALLINAWPEPRFANAAELDPGNLLDAIQTDGDASCVAADFTGDGKCDLLLAPVGRAPMLIENATPGGQWIEFDLVGTRPADPKARSSNSAIGARVEIRTGPLFQQFVVGGSAGPVASLPLRIHAGLSTNTRVEWLRILWPDAILQGELELASGQAMKIEEVSRKPSSCPYLFVWDGTRFVFVADFGGVGGLGYFVGPGEYARPDSTEYLPVPQLEPKGKHYVLQALTPLEEITYFDEAKLLAVDHPEGSTVHPNEMMAISVSPPEFELFCVRKPIDPIRATDHQGHDVTDCLLQIDRRCGGATAPDPRFTGLAKEHSVELDFGNQLAQLNPSSRLILFLHGWVEYGYSSTNYAASQAAMRTEAPTIEVLRDGKWVEVIREVGYPAGVNHMMTVDVTGRIRPTDRRIRISSNMDLHWDRIFIAPHDSRASISIKEVAPRGADLHFRGYPREYSPDGRHPNLCDYDNMDRNVSWKLMAGDYTRLGDVCELLDDTDDCFVIMGHGEEITLRFAVDDFGPVPDGCQRSFILKTDSYCKDMDLYTAFPDTVEPLPFHGMSGYPYGPDESYPDNHKTRQYRKTYNTRRVLGR